MNFDLTHTSTFIPCFLHIVSQRKEEGEGGREERRLLSYPPPFLTRASRTMEFSANENSHTLIYSYLFWNRLYFEKLFQNEFFIWKIPHRMFFGVSQDTSRDQTKCEIFMCAIQHLGFQRLMPVPYFQQMFII